MRITATLIPTSKSCFSTRSEFTISHLVRRACAWSLENASPQADRQAGRQAKEQEEEKRSVETPMIGNQIAAHPSPSLCHRCCHLTLRFRDSPPPRPPGDPPTANHSPLLSALATLSRAYSLGENESLSLSTKKKKKKKQQKVRELAMSWPDAFLLLETETKDPPASLQEKEKWNKNEGNECGGLRVARGNGGKGDEGLYEGPMVYKLLTWHRPKKKGRGEEQEEKKKTEEEEKEIEEKGSIARREWRRERETVIYRAENVTGIAWHLLGVRKTEEKQTRRLSQVVPLKGGLLMSVAFFRPPNHRVPEGSVDAHPTSTSPVEIYCKVEKIFVSAESVLRDEITTGLNKSHKFQISEKRSWKRKRPNSHPVYQNRRISILASYTVHEKRGYSTSCVPAVPKEAEERPAGGGRKRLMAEGGFTRIKRNREGSARLTFVGGIRPRAPEVDKGRVFWINYRNYVISLPRSPRTRAFDDSKSN
ncbi:hypothetical protein ALC62_03435 [Cyphomyrmex costatus]|uniref:Uncharacterized protein n=1 Tax=Cyphomyrmex costatus TaxID=456900 RepID=A0A195CYI9_9HYME|nr:hypothetical protein ALC62_03435 [Cyphomyrmex costatus]